jgi:hypothetical protein
MNKKSNLLEYSVLQENLDFFVLECICIGWLSVYLYVLKDAVASVCIEKWLLSNIHVLMNYRYYYDYLGAIKLTTLANKHTTVPINRL